MNSERRVTGDHPEYVVCLGTVDEVNPLPAPVAGTRCPEYPDGVRFALAVQGDLVCQGQGRIPRVGTGDECPPQYFRTDEEIQSFLTRH